MSFLIIYAAEHAKYIINPLSHCLGSWDISMHLCVGNFIVSVMLKDVPSQGNMSVIFWRTKGRIVEGYLMPPKNNIFTHKNIIVLRGDVRKNSIGCVSKLGQLSGFLRHYLLILDKDTVVSSYYVNSIKVDASDYGLYRLTIITFHISFFSTVSDCLF